MAEGRKPDGVPDLVEFCAAVKKAESEFVTTHVDIVAKAAEKTWQAACWLLERRKPDEFGSDRREIAQLKREILDLRREIRGGRGQVPEAGGPAAAADGAGAAGG